MYPVLSGILLIAVLTSLFRIDAGNAQAIPKSIQQGGSEWVIKERKNAWTVGIAGGLIDGTYMRFADELAKVLDDGDNLRILPMVSYGAASNLDDLLYLRGVDLAVTQCKLGPVLGDAPSSKMARGQPGCHGSGLDTAHHRRADARTFLRSFRISTRRHQPRFSSLPESHRNWCTSKPSRSRGFVPPIRTMARATE
jgi:hypothetical protein